MAQLTSDEKWRIENAKRVMQSDGEAIMHLLHRYDYHAEELEKLERKRQA